MVKSEDSLNGILRVLEQTIFPPIMDCRDWHPAMLGTNETSDREFFGGISRIEHPNGYMIGVGCGNCLTMLEAFEELPKSIVMIDINPNVVVFGRVVVEALKRYNRFEDFTHFLAQTRRIEPGFRHVQDYVEYISASTPVTADAKEVYHGFVDAPYSPDGIDAFPFRRPVNVVSFIRDRYEHFHELAKSGRMAVIFGNVYGRDFSAQISSLPEFAESTNVVYLSNSRVRHPDETTEGLKHSGRRNVYVYSRSNIYGSPFSVPSPLEYTNDLDIIYQVKGSKITNIINSIKGVSHLTMKRR